jgi:hypothetical protein
MEVRDIKRNSEEELKAKRTLIIALCITANLGARLPSRVKKRT